MGSSTYYITRRNRWSQEGGPVITESEWRKFVEADDELTFSESESETVTWESHPNVFVLESGNIVAESVGRDVVSKMLGIASSMGARVVGEDGVVYVEMSSSSISGDRKVIPRAGAALLLSIVGLTLIGIALALQFGISFDSRSGMIPMPLVALPFVSVGIVSVMVSVVFALSSIVPWNRRSSKFALIALVLDILPLLLVR